MIILTLYDDRTLVIIISIYESIFVMLSDYFYKYNKWYRLYVACQFRMLWKTRGHENNPRQPAANCGLGNISACQLDAFSEDCLDVFDLKQHS